MRDVKDISMNQSVLELLSKERLGVISVLFDGNKIHSATVHYSHITDPFKLYIQTSKTTLKARPFLNGQSGQGTMVIGFSEHDWLTLQMHGNIKAITNEKELQEIYKIHYQKHPEAEQYKGPETIFLEFTPTWWKYTDFNTNPETVISS